MSLDLKGLVGPHLFFVFGTGVTPVQAQRGGRGGDIHRVAVAHPSLHMRFPHSVLDPPVGNDVPLTHPVGTGPWRGPPAAWTRPWPSP